MKEDTLILTCKLGNEIINCYDGTHNKEQLKKWASKKILLCPVCGKPYEYCHGEVKTPYFRHMDKNECEDKYYESETEEHLNGKRDLFEWIKKQNGVTNAVLEGWIPETKQRPDIMFEYNGNKYVLEFQCSPIATEYVERHELYKASGIIDIWILGAEKYLKRNMRKKYIQDFSYAFYSYKNQEIIPVEHSDLFSYKKLNSIRHCTNFGIFYGVSLESFVFDGYIHHLYFSDIDEILKKKEYRQNLKLIYKPKYNKRHNKYLKLQIRKTFSHIERYLCDLSNKNWKFHIISDWNKNGKYTHYMIAEPRESYNHYYDTKFYEYKKKHYLKINLDNLSREKYYDFKKCGNDIEFLKGQLLPLMIRNKEVLLSYKDKDIRFMEVRDN